MFKKILFSGLLLLGTSLFATYEQDDAKLGNIAISAGIWKTTLNGTIDNVNNKVDFANDLGYKDDKNINFVSLDIKNDISWLPNLFFNYYSLSNSSNSNFMNTMRIDDSNLNGSISTSTVYSSFDAIAYGYLYQGPFEFDLGLKLKKIDFKQTIIENNGARNEITIKGPTSPVVMPHIALKMDLSFINTVLKAQLSMLSIGDVEAKDYEYSLNYRVMRNIYISYGYKYNSWKSVSKKSVHEKYNINLKGNYLSCKILF